MTVILGYEIGPNIGEGGQAKVKLAHNNTTGHYVAIKILCKSSAADKHLELTAAKKEFKIHSAASHPNIIKLYKSAEDHLNIYFVLEYAAAGELFDKIGYKHSKVEPDVGIDEEVAHFYFNQLIAAMAYLHDCGICHRDLKPEVFAN